MTYTIKSGETIFDVALICYQDASRVYDLISENPAIESIDSDITGITITYTPATVTQKEVIQTITPSKKSVTIGFTQSLFDIALQYYGSAESVYELISENGIDSILSDPTGINLKYSINNTYAPLFYRTNNINVATKPIEPTENTPSGNFILRTDGGYLLRVDGGKFNRF